MIQATNIGIGSWCMIAKLVYDYINYIN
jgi:hypothetical protein